MARAIAHELRFSLFRRVWRMRPRWLRTRLQEGILAARLPTVRRREPRPGDTLVVGLLSSSSGLGHAARLLIDQLRSMGLAVQGEDLTLFFRARPDLDAPNGASRAPAPASPEGVAVIVANPPEFLAAIAFLAARLRHRYVIAYWAWELTRAPESWHRSLAYVDEVWVPSRFVAAAMAPLTDKPVRVVPYPIRAIGPVAPPPRPDLGLRPDSVIVLFMYDPMSTIERKNPVAVVEAFRLAATGPTPSELVIKLNTSNQDSRQARQLRAIAGDDPRIHVVCGVYDEPAVLGLVQLADIVISLHRSEGFGLVLAEAMQLGKPVIATRWSGNLDFMDESSAVLVDFDLVPTGEQDGFYGVPGAQWANSRVASAAVRLRQLIGDAALRRDIGGRARDAITRWRAGIDWNEQLGPRYRSFAVRREG